MNTTIIFRTTILAIITVAELSATADAYLDCDTATAKAALAIADEKDLTQNRVLLFFRLHVEIVGIPPDNLLYFNNENRTRA